LDDQLTRQVSLVDVRRVSDVYQELKPEPVLDVLGNPGGELVVLLGDPGSGKSTLGRHLVLSLLDAAPLGKISPALLGIISPVR
jgi:ABC-type phosphate/phosphonate transport system ATPase subunit